MQHALLPFLFQASEEVRRRLGRDLQRVAVAALRAVLRHRKSLEVAHQQISFGGHHLAFSSRVNASGLIVLEIDVGDPRLADRLILEEDMRRAIRRVRGIAAEAPSRR